MPTRPGSGTPPAAADPAVGGLATMLRAEHAAIYACAWAGGTLAPLGGSAAGARELARDAYAAHRALRDALLTAILARGGEAPVAAPAYALPGGQPGGAARALTVLAGVEDAAAAAAYDAIAVLTGELRAQAVDALIGMAVRAQRARLAAGEPLTRAGRALPGR
jgi:hypothetical protein